MVANGDQPAGVRLEVVRASEESDQLVVAPGGVAVFVEEGLVSLLDDRVLDRGGAEGGYEGLILASAPGRSLDP